MNTSYYKCDDKFHTDALSTLLANTNSFGFIIVDGNGCLFGVVSGQSKQVLYSFSVELPKKHGRGGQSSVRFSRLRDIARSAYIKKVGELATKYFITNDLPNVKGLILAGIADFKNLLTRNDLLDKRLHAVVLSTVDISYEGENGFNQAIDLVSAELADVDLVKQKKILSVFFNEISRDTGHILRYLTR